MSRTGSSSRAFSRCRARCRRRSGKVLLLQQKAFGYTLEDIEKIILPMAENAQEAVGSMGNDEALAVLSERPQLLYKYFKQLFAQVTNPPIDPYRESLVMSLMSFTGRERNLLDESPQHCHQIKIPHPVLTNEDMDKLRHVQIQDFKVVEVPILFDVEREGTVTPAMSQLHEKAERTIDEGASLIFNIEREGTLTRALSQLCEKAEKAIDEGASLIILSDRGIGRSRAAIPALLAVSCVHHHLVRAGKRHLSGLAVETGEARDVMHFATLVGFGASAINPYLAFNTIAGLKKEGRLPASLTLESAAENYITAVKKGLLKIMSKMGISTIRSYKGAQLFEAVGLSPQLVDAYFPGTPSRIGGIGLDEISPRNPAAAPECVPRRPSATD